MENQVASPKKTILNYGLVLGLLSVLLGVVMYVTDNYLTPHWSLAVVGILLSIVILVIAIKAFKKENGGFLSLGEALKVGMGVALISGIIGLIWTLVLTNVLVPDYAEQMEIVQREMMTENFPNMSESQVDQAVEMNAQFTTPLIQAASSLVVSLFLGFLISLVAGLIMKQKRPYEL